MALPPDYRSALDTGLQATDQWQAGFGPYAPHPSTHLAPEVVESVLTELTERLGGNYPFFHPAYAGQMLKPPHPLAWVAYALAQLHNTNNHALDGGPATSALEKEVVQALGRAFNLPEPCLGHLTSSGTVANLEALWVARELAPGKAIGYSTAAHYTHSRMCQVLGVEGVPIETDAEGRLSPEAFERVAHRLGTLVVTLGTTGTGAVDPLADLLPLCRARGIRVHLDAAYGGFFYLIRQGLPQTADWAALPLADSLVVDPHKHGLQPYGCGCVLFADPAVGRLYRHDSPYTYFSSDELHLGEISLECSRAGAAAAALWATLRAFPLAPDRGLGPVLAACRLAAVRLNAALEASAAFTPLLPPTLDICTYYPLAPSPAAVSDRSQRIYAAGLAKPPHQQLHLSLYRVQPALVRRHFSDLPNEGAQVLRSVLLKPEHAEFVPELMARLTQLAAET